MLGSSGTVDGGARVVGGVFTTEADTVGGSGAIEAGSVRGTRAGGMVGAVETAGVASKVCSLW